MATVAKSYSNSLVAKELVEQDSKMFTATTTALELREIYEEAQQPANSYYFPLDDRTTGYLDGGVRDVEAAVAQPHFDENGAWVGTASTNLWPLTSGSQGWKAPVRSKKSVLPYGSLRHNVSVAAGGMSNTLTLGNSFTLTAGEACTVSAYYRSDTAATPQQFTLSKSTSGNSISYSNIVENLPSNRATWQRGWRTASYNESSSTAYPWISYTSATAATSSFAGLMVEKKPFVTPWSATTRAATKLTLNLHNSIALQWDQPWSIVYWKRPHGTSSDTISTGYSLDSLGCNSNSVGGGYRWWGKTLAGMTYGISGSGASFLWVNYQYLWHMHALTYDGAGNLTLRVYGFNVKNAAGNPFGLFLTQTVPLTIARADYFVNQYGYDLFLGGWDNVNVCNTYYKDLLVTKYALSNQEIDLLYNRRLRVFENKTVAANVIEGVI